MSATSTRTPILRSFCSAFLLLFLAFSMTAQEAIPIKTFHYFKKGGKKEVVSSSSAVSVNLAITDVDGNVLQESSKSKAIVFDFGGRENGLIKISYSFSMDDHVLVLRKKCLDGRYSKNTLFLQGPYSLRNGEFSQEQFAEFRVKDNGEFEIISVFEVFHDKLDPASFDCHTDNVLTIEGVIKGIGKPALPPDPGGQVDCRQEIDKNPRDCGYLRGLMRNPACAVEALNAWERYKNQLFAQCGGRSLEACYDFLACDSYDSKAGAVEKLIEELEKAARDKLEEGPSITAEDQKRWGSIEKNASYQEFQEFIEQFPSSRHRSKAQDSLAKYIPWPITFVEKKENSRVYRIENAPFLKNLRWKDASLGPGLRVDDSELATGKITLSFSELGSFLVLFEDAHQRRDSILFNTQLKGTLKSEKSDYTVSFEGGSPPYEIELVDMSQNAVVKKYPSIQTDTFLIAADDIKATKASLLKVWVRDASNIRVSLDGEISFGKTLDFHRISAYSLIVLLTLLVVYLLISFFRRRRLRKLQLQDV